MVAPSSGKPVESEIVPVILLVVTWLCPNRVAISTMTDKNSFLISCITDVFSHCKEKSIFYKTGCVLLTYYYELEASLKSHIWVAGKMGAFKIVAAI